MNSSAFLGGPQMRLRWFTASELQKRNLGQNQRNPGGSLPVSAVARDQTVAHGDLNHPLDQAHARPIVRSVSASGNHACRAFENPL